MYQMLSAQRKQKTLPQKFEHIKHHTHGGGRRFFPNGPQQIKAIPSKEVENSSPVSSIPKKEKKKSQASKQNILPQSPPRTKKEAEDSSLADHTSTLLLSESIHITP